MDTQTDSGAPTPDEAATAFNPAGADSPVESLPPATGGYADIPDVLVGAQGQPLRDAQDPAAGDMSISSASNEGAENGHQYEGDKTEYAKAAQPIDVAAFFRRSGAPPALIDVLMERVRQVDDLGYTAEHDDQQAPEQFAAAAAALCLDASMALVGEAADELAEERNDIASDAIDAWYPKNRHFTPADSRTNLVHAAAYCLAQIERYDRRRAIDRAQAAAIMRGAASEPKP